MEQTWHSTPNVVRGCGRRIKGAIYLEVPNSPNGAPIEDFLLDPPTPLNPRTQMALGVTPIGIKMVERDGVWHVLDWVGSNAYPNVADFIEEARRFGISRRVSQFVEFDKLGPGSRLLLIHSRAYTPDVQAFYLDPPTVGTLWRCPKLVHGRDYDGCCSGFWWHDIEDYAAKMLDGRVVRAMPSFSYDGWPSPQTEVRYTPAIFASFPIGGISVVRSDNPDVTGKLLNFARASKLPVEDVEA